MKNRLIYIFALIVTSLGLGACSEDKSPSFDFSGDVEIKSFTFNGREASVDNKKSTITIMLPLGTDLSSLAPKVTIADGAVVTPASGQAMNFTVAQTYTVKFKDVYKDYKVIVDVPKAEITKFSIGTAVGIIDQTTKKIKVYVPMGSDLKSLTPIVEYSSGATMTPAANSVVDFSAPVSYNLNYLESDFPYTVSVQQASTIWNGEDVTPSWWKAGNCPSVDVVPNPLTDGYNMTQNCLSILREKGNDPWSGGGLGGLNIDPTKYNKFSIRVLKSYVGNVQMEIQGDGGSNQYIKVMTSSATLGKWQEMIFELPSDHTFTKIHTILVAPQVDDTRDDPAFTNQKMYWDQVLLLPVN